MKLNCWAKSEFSAGQYVTEHNTLCYKKDLAIKRGCSVPGTVLQEVCHPEHMTRTPSVLPFPRQGFSF